MPQTQFCWWILFFFFGIFINIALKIRSFMSEVENWKHLLGASREPSRPLALGFDCLGAIAVCILYFCPSFHANALFVLIGWKKSMLHIISRSFEVPRSLQSWISTFWRKTCSHIGFVSLASKNWQTLASLQVACNHFIYYNVTLINTGQGILCVYNYETDFITSNH